jgi:hypothetical protein
MEKKKTTMPAAISPIPARRPARALTTRKLTKKELASAFGGMPPTRGCVTQGCG